MDFQSKGTKTTWVEGTNETSYKTNPMYLELPVNIGVTLPLGQISKLYVGADPYAAMGISGENTATIAGKETKSNINWGNDNPIEGTKGTVASGQFKKYDFGFNVIAGLDFGHLGIHAQYGAGLTNTIPSGSSNKDNKSNQHRTLSLGGVIYF